MEWTKNNRLTFGSFFPLRPRYIKHNILKKIILFAAALVMLASCNSNNKPAPNNGADSTAVSTDSTTTATTEDSLRYEGTIPAADGPGTQYTIALANDSTLGYSVTRTDKEAENGKDFTTTFTGNATKVSKNGREGLKLNLGEDDDVYFVQLGGSVLRMVNEDLEKAASGLNYDLKRIK